MPGTGVIEPLTVDVWSDVQCLWCYIGHERLRQAVQQWGGPALVRHHTYELDPSAPEDFDAGAFLSEQRGLDADAVAGLHAQVDEVAEPLGIRFAWDLIRPTNSLLANDLLHFADSHGDGHTLRQRLFRAYFTEGRHLGRVVELADLAAEVGLDRDQAVRALVTREFRHLTDADRSAAQQMGISGVPFHVVDERYAVPGAQPVDVLLRVLARADADRASVSAS
jgi:predicted DsbA family dithiol-disulfide isomerase